MWELIYLVLYLIGKSTEFVYNNKVIFILFLIVCIIVFDVYDLLIHKNENSNIGRIIITNLIVITIGITTLTNKALISSMILIVFDFIIIYSLLFLIKKVTEYLNR
ncbi:hypothetical protein FZM91_07105 [Enterococcus faecium]|jgi:hypothetical protein|uniref:Uncharacterized protein n=6 Tax=cellular organisms TaxID=131567 RepID=Q33E33_ENTFC|nr:Hypothetical protein [Enterococcus faecalis]ELB16001.1 hypothetical protein OIQ_05582 [Enterococcus faecium EnGen0025]EOF93145.1 hypothetical protein SKI_02893 [Enterococcus faecium EnGen0167]EOI35653.1 hypothetical protein UIS_02877 [Enterococcus faecium EnGen0313]KAB7597379.1 hypothetical protein GBM58_15440 [Enterococcus faecium]